MKLDSDQEQKQDGNNPPLHAHKQAAEMIHQQHDTSYKFLLSSKRLFVQLLNTFIQRSWAKEIVEDQVEQIPHSFVLQDFKRQEADIVYRAEVKGQEVLFYVLVELQSSVDHRMPYRLLLYQVEIWRYWLSNQVDGMKNRKSFSLPPIVPIVLYNGKKNWTAKRRFRQLLENEEMFDTELMSFEYLLIDVASYTEEELLSLSNTLSAVFLLDKAKDQEQLRIYLSKLMKTIRQIQEEDQQRFVAWMSNMLRTKLPENDLVVQQLINDMKGEEKIMGLEKVLDDMIKKGKEEGKEEGYQIGEEQTLEKIATRLLAENIDDETISRVTGYPLEKIEQLRKKSR